MYFWIWIWLSVFFVCLGVFVARTWQFWNVAGTLHYNFQICPNPSLFVLWMKEPWVLGAGSPKQQRIIKLKDSRTCLVLAISDIFKRLNSFLADFCQLPSFLPVQFQSHIMPEQAETATELNIEADLGTTRRKSESLQYKWASCVTEQVKVWKWQRKRDKNARGEWETFAKSEVQHLTLIQMS